ncbi:MULTISPECIES: DUF485 domain-containing protein [Brevibacterium]|jgi:uncharacterized membrane protein (DUF485 family)|uniref:DUF485 domain-containing protein n=1 Tax=Brevibacterium salitolerans TaxID=1403566 RepID=A0ABN2X5I8_9MICO|nr:DUF485 domain-containing protein [Brevibacterium sp.]
MTDHRPPESVSPGGPPAGGPGVDYVAVQESPAFSGLRRTHRSFVFPLAVFFLLWYAAYVLLGAYAHEFMARPVFGTINMGILLGLLQFVTTFVITTAYVMYANRRLDPQAEAIRADLEKQEAAA